MPAQGFDGWFAATGISNDAAEAAAKRVHANAADKLGNDLLFCGGPTDDVADARLFFVPSGEPSEVAGRLAVGTQAAFYDEAAPEQTLRLITAIDRLVPLSPLIVNSSAFSARFLRTLDEASARLVLQVAEAHDYQGMEIYGEADYEEEEQGGAVGKLVREQAIHLWWD